MSITARPALAPEFWAPEDMYERKLEVRYVGALQFNMYLIALLRVNRHARQGFILRSMPSTMEGPSHKTCPVFQKGRDQDTIFLYLRST